MKKSRWKSPGWYLFLLLLAAAVALEVQLFVLNVVPAMYLILGSIVLVLLLALLYFLLGSKRVNRLNRVLGVIFGLILCVALTVGNLFVFKTNSAFKNMEHDGEQKNVISVVVKKDSGIDRIEDLDGALGILKNIDRDGTDRLLSELQKKKISVTTKEYNSLTDLASGLYGAGSDAIVLNESYRSMIADSERFENFDEETKVIYTFEYYSKVESTAKTVDVTSKAFTVLVSGIDTYGSIGTTSRSDVNMIVTVNPQTKQILLVSIPRDYYVETDCDPALGCGIGQMDKLTHTGLHGVETTKATLEKTFGIDINYTLRVNFSSVQKIVDALGGIEVNNPQAFSIGGYTFEPGVLTLNGDQALMFSRERKSFAGGDRERGRNQMRVITGMINKASSAAILSNYMGFMDAISDSFETDMTSAEMKALVQMQLKEGGSWNIQQMSVDGTGGTDFCYELQDNAWVMYPDAGTIDAAVEAIGIVQNGGTPELSN